MTADPLHPIVWLWDPQPEDDSLRFLRKLGPIYRYGIRPCERTVRRIVFKLYGRKLQLLVAQLNTGNILGAVLRDLLQIAWVALALYSTIWIWFTW